MHRKPVQTDSEIKVEATALICSDVFDVELVANLNENSLDT